MIDCRELSITNATLDEFNYVNAKTNKIMEDNKSNILLNTKLNNVNAQPILNLEDDLDDRSDQICYIRSLTGTLSKFDRNEMLLRIGRLILEHIIKGEKVHIVPTFNAALFDEANFLLDKWELIMSGPFISNSPCFIYECCKIENIYNEKLTVDKIHTFLTEIFDKLQITAECAIISII